MPTRKDDHGTTCDGIGRVGAGIVIAGALSARGTAAAQTLPGEDRRHPAADRLDGPDHQEDRRQRAARDRARQPGRRHQGLPGAVHPARRSGPADGRRRCRQVPGRGRARAGAHRNRLQRRQPADPLVGHGAVEDRRRSLAARPRALHDAGAGGQDRRLLLPHPPDRKTQAYATASKSRASAAIKKIAVIYVNTDFGTGMVQGLLHRPRSRSSGGEGRSPTSPYNDNQPSYRAEVTQALAAKPESLLLRRIPAGRRRPSCANGCRSAARRTIALNNSDAHHGLRQGGRRGKFIEDAFGMDNAQVAGPHGRCLQQAFEEKFKTDAKGPACYTQYDALMVMALAMNIAKDLTGPAIKDAVRKIHVPTEACRHRARTNSRRRSRSSRKASRSSMSARPGRSSSTPTAM